MNFSVNHRLSIALVCGFIALGLLAGRLAQSGAADTNGNLAAGKLSGLYVRQQSVPLFFNGRMTFNLTRDYFYFFPDGHIVFGVPVNVELKEHPTAADYAALASLPPSDRGTYRISNGEITIAHEQGSKETEPFSVPKPGDDSVIQIGPASTVGSVKAVPFKDGQTIDGEYQFDGTIGLGQPNTIFNVTTLAFHADGTLGSNHLSGVDTQGIDTAVGNSGVTTGGQTKSAGTYHFSGYKLQTTIGGKGETQSVFHWAGDDETKPGMICISGKLFSRQEK